MLLRVYDGLLSDNMFEDACECTEVYMGMKELVRSNKMLSKKKSCICHSTLSSVIHIALQKLQTERHDALTQITQLMTENEMLRLQLKEAGVKDDS